MTRVMGFEELLSDMSDQDPRSSFVMESALPTWGIPLLLTYLLTFARAIRSTQEARWSLLGGDPIVGPFQVPPRKAESRLRTVAPYFLRPMCGSGGPYPGHIPSDQVAFCLTKHCSVGQCVFHRSGCVPSFPISIEWGKGESFLL